MKNLKVLTGFILLLLLSLQLFGQSTIDSQFEEWMIDRQIPGLAVGYVSDGELLYEGYFGMSNIESEVSVNQNTSFMLASVSKHFTHFAALIALDEGDIESLDDPVNKYLPFDIQHPFDNGEITIQHLIDHTSGIRDNWDEMPYLSSDEQTRPLGEYLKAYLTLNGDIYFDDLNYYTEGIGDENYSNIGFALLGFVVESATDTDFATYAKNKIFEPLCMNHTSFLLDDLDISEVAMPYNASGAGFSAIGHYSYNDYPSGRMRSSLRDMANYAIACLQLGSMDGTTVLTPPVSYQIFNGHGGGDQGVATGLSLDKTNMKATIILMNTDASTGGMANLMRESEELFTVNGPDALDCGFVSQVYDEISDATFIQNPVSHEILFSNDEIISTKLLNIHGQCIAQKENPQGIRFMNVSSIPSGTYFLASVDKNDVSSIHKILVIKN